MALKSIRIFLSKWNSFLELPISLQSDCRERSNCEELYFHVSSFLIFNLFNGCFQNRNFTEAVFDLFNCETVQLEHSSFTNNSGTGILFETFRGNTGAVALGYTNYPTCLKQPRVSISHCDFIGNSAHGTTELQTSERAVASSIFIGRGGALGIFIGSASSSPILNMTDCLILGNYARLFGGGIYTNINSIGTNVSFTFSKVNIISNTISKRVQTGGGGVQVAFLSASDSPVPPHSVVFRDCNFENNVGESGGGIYVFTPFVGE